MPYMLMVILCGIPIFYMEILIGQFSGTGCIGMWRMAPILKGTGLCMVIVNAYCVCYYSVIISYPIRMLYYCFWKTIPWTGCDHEWNTSNCTTLDKVRSAFNNIIKIFSCVTFCLFLKIEQLDGKPFTSSADEFFQ